MKLLYWSPGSPRPAVAAALRDAGRRTPGRPLPPESSAAGEIHEIGVDPAGRGLYAVGFGGAASAAVCLRLSSGVLSLFPGTGEVVLVPEPAAAELTEKPARESSAGEAARELNVFYHCYGSAHSSVVVASIHLGFLPAGRVPSVREICALRWFDRVRHREIGEPHMLGVDESGVGVFVVGLGPRASPSRRFLEDLIRLCGLSRRIVLVDCLHLAGTLVRIGGFMSRRLGVTGPGRVLAATGIRRDYWDYVSLACRTRLRLSKPGFEAGFG
ncbi:MAG: DUF3189 family protein [Firmicutes bacterium]|nr:DUF3189 family protein [Bacillota bacterium]